MIGTSMDGILPLLLAAMRPAALAGVVLNDVGPELDPVGIARIASYVGRTPAVTSWDQAAQEMRALNAAAFPDFEHTDWPLFAALGPISTLAIRGELSDILSEATLARRKTAKADLEILRVARRGHAPTLDEPECVAAIERFLVRI